jgi:hypothetical protein
MKCKLLKVSLIECQQNLWKDVWLCGKFNLWPYANKALLCINIPEDPDYLTPFGGSLSYQI